MRSRRAFSLIEMLVVVVLLALLAAFLLPRYLSNTKNAHGKTVEAPKTRAMSVDCANNLRQIRAALQMATTTDEENRPQTLAELKTYGITESMTRCSVSGQPFQYNPSTGQVACTHPTHAGL